MGAIADSADSLTAAVGKADLSSARNLESVFADLKAFDEQVANAKRALASRITDEFPADPGVAEMVHRQAAQQSKFASSNDEVRNQFRRAHQHEWERLENPRTNEEAWDHLKNNQE